MPFRYGLDFDLSTIIALGLIFMITAIEAYGDITANSLISGEPVEGDTFVKRASGVSLPTASTPCWRVRSTPSPTPSLHRTTE